MIGRKKIENAWKEEFEMTIMDGKVKDTCGILEININDMVVEFISKHNNSWDRKGTYEWNTIEYCIYIPHNNKVFEGVTNLNEQFNDDEELLERIALIRSDIEEKIKEYLLDNEYIEMDENITPVLDDEIAF